MRRSDVVGTSVVIALLLAGGAYLWFSGGPKNSGTSAADQQALANANPPGADAARTGRGNRPRGFWGSLFGGGGGGPVRNAGPGPGGPPPMPFSRLQRLTDSLSALGQASLDPAFEMTVDQKAKIAALRAEYTAADEKWQAENAEELRKIGEGLRSASGDDRQALDKKRQEIMRTAPSSDAALAKLKAILTPEQVKAMEAQAAEMRPPGFGPGGSPGAPGGPRRGEGNSPQTRPTR